MRVTRVAIFALACSAGCAAGDAGGDGGTATLTTGQPTETETGDTSTGTDAGPDMGDNGCAGGCSAPPGSCYQPVGSCVDGACDYPPVDAGTPCGAMGYCDAMGNCVGGDGDGDGDGDCGDDLDCERPHASGGVCQDGQCTGWTCDAGWDDCNTNMGDGCEADLASPDHCGACDATCVAGDHANGACNAGQCEFSCSPPWENCDGDWQNGCEIPTGTPNQCNFAGLDMNNGCGTAWCGQSNAPKTQNFGTWYCLACSNCTVPGNGQCQWCNHNGNAQWFPVDTCGCAGYEDLVCSP